MIEWLNNHPYLGQEVSLTWYNLIELISFACFCFKKNI